jgi:spermidine synthase
VLEDMNEMCEPFVEETRYHKSLHFDLSEYQSRMSKREPDKLVVDYTRTMMGFLLFNAQPERIAMLGLGGGSLAKFCFRELPHARIDVVEINPRVVALREEFLVPPDDARFRIHLDDGARFIAQSRGRFDVLLVDAYTRQGLPSRLASQEFYDNCRDALVEDGVMVLNLYCGNSDAQIERIRQSFGDAMFSIYEDDRTNRVVFALVGDAFRRRRFVRPQLSSHLTAAAWQLLKPAFRRIVSAMPAI